MRKAEVALADGATFGKYETSWDNVKWRIGGVVYPALTPALRAKMRAKQNSSPMNFDPLAPLC
eukprot:5396274-Prymnesium_polylepis.1